MKKITLVLMFVLALPVALLAQTPARPTTPNACFALQPSQAWVSVPQGTAGAVCNPPAPAPPRRTTVAAPVVATPAPVNVTVTVNGDGDKSAMMMAMMEMMRRQQPAPAPAPAILSDNAFNGLGFKLDEGNRIASANGEIMKGSNLLLAEANRLQEKGNGSLHTANWLGGVNALLNGGQLVTGIMTVDRLGGVKSAVNKNTEKMGILGAVVEKGLSPNLNVTASQTATNSANQTNEQHNSNTAEGGKGEGGKGGNGGNVGPITTHGGEGGTGNGGNVNNNGSPDWDGDPTYPD